jgi:Zn-dependent metalloprotease
MVLAPTPALYRVIAAVTGRVSTGGKMIQQFTSARRRAGLGLVAVASLTVAGLAAGTSYASGSGSPAASAAASHRSARASVGHAVKDPYVDVTDQGAAVQTRALRTASRVTGQPATRRFLKAGPTDGSVLDIAGSTGTVRWLGNLAGTLTGPSSDSPKKVTLDYVSAHLADLGLVAGDLDTLHLKRDYRDIAGTHHLYFTQTVNGTPASRNGLTASVDKQGRLLTLGGSPITTATATKLPPASALTITSPAEALARTRGTLAPGGDLSDDAATRVVFATADGLRPAWETVVTSSETPATTVIDAVTGQILQRTPLTQYEHSTGRVFKFFPRSHKGGRQVRVDFTKKHWLGKHAHILSGNNSHTYSDVDDNNRASAQEEVHPRHGQSWGFRLKPFHLSFAKKFCSNPWPCTWNPNKPFSWRVNRAQNATQVFFFVNNWHDHLKAAPIGFTEAAGNFQLKNHTKQGKGGDPVTTQTDDGANTGTGRYRGLPDGGHVDNANMSTPPDGHKPRMQMYLQHFPFSTYGFSGDPFSPTNVGDEADTVYHEYTHGLSNRLNVDVRGRSTLRNGQSGAMGEAWSDWYAMDYLVKKGLQRDRAGQADIQVFKYDGLGVFLDRTEPLDCKVGQSAQLCTGGTTGHEGGYTYDDYGNVAGGPEVHADGEIWSQTLWDLRDELGSNKTEALVTRAMELAPYTPSFIDMRNAILVADTALYDGANHDAIWNVFANRGMGFSAGALGSSDSEPAAAFDLPPATVATGDISGTITDGDTDQPLEGVTVTLAFDGWGAANPSAVTDQFGDYQIQGVPRGSYAKLIAQGHGYRATKSVDVGPGTNDVDFAPRFNWAGPGTGTRVVSASGKDYSGFGCGPEAAIDGSTAGWSTNAGPGSQTTGVDGFGKKRLVIKLGAPVDVTGFGVDPSATCGDDETSSTAGYKIEGSASSGGPWSTLATGTFTGADNERINEIAASGSTAGVRFVKFTIKSDQVPDFGTTCAGGGGPSGCHFTDLTELQVFGSAAV